MYQFTKIQPILRASDFGTKLPVKLNGKKERKKCQNINKNIAVCTCTKFELILRIPDFGQNLPKKINKKNFEIHCRKAGLMA